MIKKEVCGDTQVFSDLVKSYNLLTLHKILIKSPVMVCSKTTMNLTCEVTESEVPYQQLKKKRQTTT